MDAPDVFPLDDAAVQLIDELQREVNERLQRMNGAMLYFMRIHNLQGDWTLAPNGRELVRQCQPSHHEA